jgi:hypothetical protein
LVGVVVVVTLQGVPVVLVVGQEQHQRALTIQAEQEHQGRVTMVGLLLQLQLTHQLVVVVARVKQVRMLTPTLVGVKVAMVYL